MSLIDLARKDAAFIVSDGNGFAVPITIIKGGISYAVKGTAKRHHTTYDDVGNVVNTIDATCTFSELKLLQSGLNLRVNSEISKSETNKLRIEFADAIGEVFAYKIKEIFPDEHLGLIVFILGNV